MSQQTIGQQQTLRRFEDRRIQRDHRKMPGYARKIDWMAIWQCVGMIIFAIGVALSINLMIDLIQMVRL